MANKKGGAPTKYRKAFHCDDFIRLSMQGKNTSQIALEWRVDRGTIANWANKHPEFISTLKKGKDFLEGWYMNLGQLAMLNQATVNGQKVKIDLGMYVWLTKNLFKWGEKVLGTPQPAEYKTKYSNLSDEELDAL